MPFWMGFWLHHSILAAVCKNHRFANQTYSFVLQDRIGIDVELLDEMQKSILGLYKSPNSPSQPAADQTAANLDAIQDSINGLCSASIQSAMYKAAGQLLDDLPRNVRLLGKPERYCSSTS